MPETRHHAASIEDCSLDERFKVIVLLAVTALAVLIIVTDTSVSVGPDGSLPLLVWLVGVIATVLLLGLSLSGIRRSYRGHYLKSWWNLGNKAEEPSWPDVLA